jgi:PncC family amidohydrolase
MGERKLEEIVGALLLSMKLKLSLAESCTGGLLSKKITDIPGSSEYFSGGIVSYGNEIKGLA